jgi:hypothetical protein
MIMKALMRIRPLHLVVAFLTLVGFFAIVCTWRSYSRIEDYLVTTLSPPLDGEQFIPLMDACGPVANSHQYLILTTGESLEQTGEGFSSRDAAHIALERRLEHASEILDRTDMLDGGRVIAVFPSGASILSTHGSVLAAINAPTVQVALEFEAAFEKRQER